MVDKLKWLLLITLAISHLIWLVNGLTNPSGGATNRLLRFPGRWWGGGGGASVSECENSITPCESLNDWEWESTIRLGVGHCLAFIVPTNWWTVSHVLSPDTKDSSEPIYWMKPQPILPHQCYELSLVTFIHPYCTASATYNKINCGLLLRTLG